MDKKDFRFLDWEVYKNTKDFCREIFRVVDKVPKQYRFELSSQLIRSSTSILLNIAEGSGKNSDKELNRFFDIALGSINETVANLDLMLDNKLISEKDFDILVLKLKSISCQIGGFKKHLRS